MSFGNEGSGEGWPPDTQVAAGPNDLMEMLSSSTATAFGVAKERGTTPEALKRGGLSTEERYTIYREVQAEMRVAQNALTGLKDAGNDVGSAARRLDLVRGFDVQMSFGEVDFAGFVERARALSEDISRAVNDLQRMVDGG